MKFMKKMIFCIGFAVLVLLYSTNSFAQETNGEEIDGTEIELLNENGIEPRINMWSYIITTTGTVGVPTGTYIPGASSYYITLLQASLNALSFNCGTADGIYGSNSKNAVMNFQSTYGLTADGIVGHDTWVMLTSNLDAKGIKVPFQK